MRKYIEKVKNNELMIGSLINFSVKIISFTLNYLIMYLLINFYGIELYGKYNLYLTLINLLCVAIVFGTDTFFLKEIAVIQDQKNRKLLFFSIIKVLSINIVVLLLFFTILFFIETPLNTYIEKNNIKVFVILLLAIFLSLTLIFTSGIRGTKKVLLYSLSQQFILRISLYIILIIGIIYNLVLETILYASFFMNLIVIFFIFYTYVLFEKNVNNIRTDKRIEYPISKLYSGVIYIFVSSLLFLIMSRTDTLFLSYFYDLSTVGYYNTALQLSFVINFAMSSINGILSPIISRNYYNNKIKELTQILKQANIIILLTSSVTGFILILLIKPLLNIINVPLTSEFYIAMLILIFGQLISASMGSIINLLNMSGNFKQAFISNLIAVIVNIVFCVLFIPKFGIIGASISMVVAIITKDIVATIYGFIIFKFKFSLYDLRKHRRNLDE